jgi:hypothetical protein
MNRRELVLRVLASRRRFDAMLARVPEDRLTEQGVAGEWSVQDVIAHLTWFDRQMIGLVEAKAFVGSDLWALPPHERNAAVFQLNRHRSLAEVTTEANLVFGVLVDQLGTLSDQDLADPGSFPGMPPDWVPGEIFAQNTFEHYDAHAEGLRRWLDAAD